MKRHFKRYLLSALLAWPFIATANPPIVLQAGLGDDHRVWQQVHTVLAPDHRVIALDRPGHGQTPDTEAPRDPCTIAAEQRAQLQAAGLAPPYLLVGHSMGGFYQFVYAKLYPQEVAGLVLVDATPPGHWARMQQEAPQAATLLKVLKAVAFKRIDRREFDAQAECLERLDLQQPLNRPTRVLVAGRFRPEEGAAFEAMMRRSRQQWLPLTGATELQTIPNSGHYIQKEQAHAVIDAVLGVLNEPGVSVGPSPKDGLELGHKTR